MAQSRSDMRNKKSGKDKPSLMKKIGCGIGIVFIFLLILVGA